MTPVTQNLHFMVHEVVSQVEQTLQFFTEPNPKLVEKIRDRDDYIDTMKSMILEKTYQILQSSNRLGRMQVNLLRSSNTIATNLERIADFTVNMIRQSGHMTDISFFRRFDYQGFFEEILMGLEHIPDALNRRDIGLAFRICQSEFKLDEMYAASFNTILYELTARGHTGNLVTSLMIFHYLERMGDSILNIGEAIIYAIIGEKMKIHQYKALTKSLSDSGLETPISDVEFESIWGTRSGCRIGVVGEKPKETEPNRPVLFKHGNLKKLVKEKDNIARWEDLVPGLPPQVCGFYEGDGGDGSILLEYLPGCTFQEIVLNGNENMLKDALFMITSIIDEIWTKTKSDEPANAGFYRQITNRMDAVYRLHPYFNYNAGRIGDLRINSFGQLLNSLKMIESELIGPFSVFIHGDMNINNIIYDSHAERLHFIDLHRSGQSDCVQDISVFLISLYRLPVFDIKARHRINQTIMDFFEFAKNYATHHNDDTFEARLALGLGRSLFTSTRFEMNRKFAKKMFKLSVYLIDKLVSHHPESWADFELPGEILVY
ncbi:MAG: phosphate uptake regulator PhoU [Proteobacteria bacterium]|nr:phosphate uptake regulator PhoU [Pseudomonadota bacterium]